MFAHLCQQNKWGFESNNNNTKSTLTYLSFTQEYLATLGLVHGDLACRNVYMEAGHKTVRISDFSLSPSEGKGGGEEDVYLNTMTGRLPVRWMAIESITDGEFTTVSDVWAFGITLWEIVMIGNTNNGLVDINKK